MFLCLFVRWTKRRDISNCPAGQPRHRAGIEGCKQYSSRSEAVYKFAEDFGKLQSFKMKGMWVNCSVLVCSRLLSLSTEYLNQLFFWVGAVQFQLAHGLSHCQNSISINWSLEWGVLGAPSYECWIRRVYGFSKSFHELRYILEKLKFCMSCSVSASSRPLLLQSQKSAESIAEWAVEQLNQQSGA